MSSSSSSFTDTDSIKQYLTDFLALQAQPTLNYSEAVPITGIADDAILKEILRSRSRMLMMSGELDRAFGIDEVLERGKHKGSRDTTDREKKNEKKSDKFHTTVRDLEKGSESDSFKSLDDEENPYDRFSERTKSICVTIAALSCFLSPMSGLAFLPAVPEIADRFNTTGEIINVSAAVYCVFMALSPCLFSPVSDIYGRRKGFLTCLALYCLSTVLVAVSTNLAMFFVFRALTALFATAFFSFGAHIVSDVYPPAERGKNMLWILSGTQLGTALGGVLGGIIVNFVNWRIVFWVLAAMGLVILVVVFFCLPETMAQTKHQLMLCEARKTQPKKRFIFVWYNPLRVALALKHPTLFLDGFVVMAMLYNMYLMLTPIRFVMNPRFGLTSPLFSGLFYLAPGAGYFVGTFFGGRWADHVVKKWIKKRGRRVPEDRLRQSIIPLTFVYPVSILIYGWSVEKKVGGMAVPIIFMFLNGLSQTIVFPATNTYCLDAVPELNGDAIASSYFSRFLAAAIGSATCLRSINTIGVGWTCTISAGVLWVALAMIFVLVFWGENLRMGYLVKLGMRSQGEWDDIKERRKNEPVF